MIVDGHEVLWTEPGADPFSWGSFPMAPYAGRVGGGRVMIGGVEHQLPLDMPPHAIHGTVYDRPWRVERRSESALVMSTELGPDWPVAGWCEQTLDLSDTDLRAVLAVHATSGEFPASIGWHPWFRTRLDSGDELTLRVRARRQAGRGADHLPTGEWIDPLPGPWDDCFGDVSWPVELSWGDAVAVRIESECRYVVVYDERPHAWCVEPQTAPPDALGDGADIVRSGAPLIASMIWRW